MYPTLDFPSDHAIVATILLPVCAPAAAAAAAGPGRAGPDGANGWRCGHAVDPSTRPNNRSATG